MRMRTRKGKIALKECYDAMGANYDEVLGRLEKTKEDYAATIEALRAFQNTNS